jgi:hypothetical protein
MDDDVMTQVAEMRAEMAAGFAEMRQGFAAMSAAIAALADRHFDLAARVDRRPNGHSGEGRL